MEFGCSDYCLSRVFGFLQFKLNNVEMRSLAFVCSLRPKVISANSLV